MDLILLEKKFKAFTLIELVVTIGIIAVLVTAAFAILRPLNYIKRSNDARRMSDLRVIQTAIEQFYGNENVYPSGASLPPVIAGGAWTYDSITYLNSTPTDPDPARSYYYEADRTCGDVASTGAYIICANLELSGNACNLTSPATYNYCVTNPF